LSVCFPVTIEEVDELTKKMKPVYKGVYTPVTKKILNTKLLTKG
jgi:hypothetical protein